jgi:starch synthase
MYGILKSIHIYRVSIQLIPLNDKYKNKEALRNRLWLRHDFKPIVSVIGRLDHQKGVDLIRHGIFYSLANGC